jgi:lipoate---protein ligase
MKYCDLTLPSPEENLACDEALLDVCEAGLADELLRVWEPEDFFVVVGYGNKVETEVNRDFCQQNGIPILRRCTGGGTVLQGPGCLNYSLILRVDNSRPLGGIGATNEFILARHQAVLASLVVAPVEHQGQTDLAIGGLKFSGNAQRRKKRCLLFHGSFLLHLDIGLVEKTLRMPSRQPAYRVHRSHSEFLVNLKMPARLLKAALLECWNATAPLGDIPFREISRLASEKYALDEWNFRF